MYIEWYYPIIKFMPRRILYVVNDDSFFLSHRLPLAQHAIKLGYEVYLLSSDNGHREMLEYYGIKCVTIPFENSGTNPIHEINCIIRLVKWYRRLRPDIIHQITLKATFLGSIAAKIARCRNVVNAISGFGFVFTDGRQGIVTRILKLLLPLSFKNRSASFILQNPDDYEFIINKNWVPNSNVFLIKGSGVDLDKFKYAPPSSESKLVVLFPARVLRDKGIIEFIEAARQLKEEYFDKLHFIIAGDCNCANPTSLSSEELQPYLIPDYLDWIGYQQDMISVFRSSHIVVLPSYREGLPKSLIEACAIGRPIITTDAIGCRECVIHGYNGLLVPLKSSMAIAESIKLLLSNNEHRIQMGVNSRSFAEREFSIDSVVDNTFSIYDRYFTAET